MGQELLKDTEIQERLKNLRGWTLSGKEIRKTIEAKDFVRAMALVNAIALLAERRNHHPDIDIRWNKVHLALSTHSAGGLTDRDFELASAIDQL